ncbi:MAG: hypothetical protein M1401_06920, partial [Chloroflexi bacterium]|nr:hypothetical protein [Chloroflexota bacterium]
MADLFRDLQKAHASQREAQMTHGVYHVKKDGNLYKYPTVTGRSVASALASCPPCQYARPRLAARMPRDDASDSGKSDRARSDS